MIQTVSRARNFDLMNQLFADLLSLLAANGGSGVGMQGDDADNWEKVHIAWVLALSSTFTDVRCLEICGMCPCACASAGVLAIRT